MSIIPFSLLRTHREACQAKQSGVVLFVALIVLVAMALAAIALFRSVDTANVVAGNQAFKQSALNATDLGIEAAMAKFDVASAGALSGEAATHSDSAANCYLSTAMQQGSLDVRGVPRLLLNPATVQAPFTAAFDTTYATCKVTNANGETARYIIDRQCDASTAGVAADNTKCNVASVSTRGRTEGDLHTGSETVPLYRVSVRVDGTNHAVSYAQVLFRP